MFAFQRVYPRFLCLAAWFILHNKSYDALMLPTRSLGLGKHGLQRGHKQYVYFFRAAPKPMDIGYPAGLSISPPYGP